MASTQVTPVGISKSSRRNLSSTYSSPSEPIEPIDQNASPFLMANMVNLLIDKTYSMEANIKDLNDSIAELVISNENKSNKIIKLEEKIKSLEKTTEDQDVNLNTLNQYGRREHIELVGVKESIPQKDLEQYVIELLDKIGVKLNRRDIVAVHRIGKFRRNKNWNIKAIC